MITKALLARFESRTGRDDEIERLLAGAPAIQQLDVLACKLPDAGGLTDITRGLVLTFKARQGHEEQVAQFLRDAQRYVDDEPGTRAWFALQLDAGQFGIFDVFPDNGARFAHMAGHVPRELAKHALTLLGGMPDMHLLDVVAVSHQSTAAA